MSLHFGIKCIREIKAVGRFPLNNPVFDSVSSAEQLLQLDVSQQPDLHFLCIFYFKPISPANTLKPAYDTDLICGRV